MKTRTAIRTRFAPSPTGYLHVGGARTALFNYLFARHEKGQFLLRIEDTDKERSRPEHTEAILDSLRWLGLDWDGRPVFQSAHEQRHQEVCHLLLQKSKAYPCFCSQETLIDKREKARSAGLDTRYDRTCLGLAPEETQRRMSDELYTIRFRVPEGETVFEDLVHGRIVFRHEDIEDFVIQRSDGSPVYQIAVVADDHDMEITHVIRGDDHLTNTPKQILIYQALDWVLPRFAHVPLILGQDKKRLSKRHGATSVEAFRDQGMLPETLINSLALLGWSPGDDRERMDLKSLIDAFSLSRISGKPAVFDIKKLEWMNAAYLSETSDHALLEKLQTRIRPMLESCKEAVPAEHLVRIAALLKPRMKTLNDFSEQAAFFFTDPVVYDALAADKYWNSPDVADRLTHITQRLESVEIWEEEGLEVLFRNEAEAFGTGAGKWIHPVRLAVTGSGASPGLFEVMVLLGKTCVIRRLKSAMEHLRLHPPGQTARPHHEV